MASNKFSAAIFAYCYLSNSLGYFSDPVALHQTAKWEKLPVWSTSKWTYDDRKFKEFRIELEKLKFGGFAPKSKIEEYHRKYVDPYVKALSEATSIDSFSGIKLSAEQYYKLLAVLTYYPPERRLSIDRERMIKGIPGPNSYEFARVAFCVLSRDITSRSSLLPLTERLLSAWPKDPMVRLHAASLWRKVNGSEKYADRACGVIDDLLTEFPKREDMFLPEAVMLYMHAWDTDRAIHRFKDKAHSSAVLKQLMVYFDRALKLKDLHPVYRDGFKSDRERILKEAKKAGIKAS